MKDPKNVTLSPKGKALLAVLCNEIRRGRIQKRKPETFLSYSEALRLLGNPQDGPTYTEGARLQFHGLTNLNEWSMATPSIPKVTGLIVNLESHKPSKGYVESNGHSYSDMRWIDWWLNEADKAIDFDWDPYLK